MAELVVLLRVRVSACPESSINLGDDLLSVLVKHGPVFEHDDRNDARADGRFHRVAFLRGRLDLVSDEINAQLG